MEVATILDDLTRLHIQPFDGVRRVHDPTNLSNDGIFLDGRCGRGDARSSHEASEGRFVMISNNCRECTPDLLKCPLAHQMRVDASSNVGSFKSNSIAAIRWFAGQDNAKPPSVVALRGVFLRSNATAVSGCQSHKHSIAASTITSFSR